MRQRPEIISLLGIPHYARPAVGEELAKLESELREAADEVEAEPGDAGKRIMHGRRLAYLWRYQEAIAVYSETLTELGESAALYRHRGHRHLSVRRFGPAVRDLERADVIQPSDFDITYHLGLARWLLGDYAGARAAYESFFAQATDPEERVAMSYWLYMALRRAGDGQAAAALLEGVGSPDVTENRHYLDLLRLFGGEHDESDIVELAKEGPLAAGTLGFGLGCWHLFAGRHERAAECFVQVVQGDYWPAFGFIAAESELARLQGMLPV